MKFKTFMQINETFISNRWFKNYFNLKNITDHHLQDAIKKIVIEFSGDDFVKSKEETKIEIMDELINMLGDILNIGNIKKGFTTGNITNDQIKTAVYKIGTTPEQKKKLATILRDSFPLDLF